MPKMNLKKLALYLVGLGVSLFLVVRIVQWTIWLVRVMRLPFDTGGYGGVQFVVYAILYFLLPTLAGFLLFEGLPWLVRRLIHGPAPKEQSNYEAYIDRVSLRAHELGAQVITDQNRTHLRATMLGILKGLHSARAAIAAELIGRTSAHSKSADQIINWCDSDQKLGALAIIMEREGLIVI